jgi:hypothetical protein
MSIAKIIVILGTFFLPTSFFICMEADSRSKASYTSSTEREENTGGSRRGPNKEEVARTPVLGFLQAVSSSSETYPLEMTNNLTHPITIEVKNEITIAPPLVTLYPGETIKYTLQQTDFPIKINVFHNQNPFFYIIANNSAKIVKSALPAQAVTLAKIIISLTDMISCHIESIVFKNTQDGVIEAHMGQKVQPPPTSNRKGCYSNVPISDS